MKIVGCIAFCATVINKMHVRRQSALRTIAQEIEATSGVRASPKKMSPAACRIEPTAATHWIF
eukprot:SAG31_NODE_24788_length_474_cov_0.816000_1_plen_62_part_01